MEETAVLRMSAVFLAAFVALASPIKAGFIYPYPVITYDFTGTLDRMVAGTNKFSGSLVYTDTSENPQGKSYGNGTATNLQVSLNVAGHSITIGVYDPHIDLNLFGYVEIDHNDAVYRAGDRFITGVSNSANKTDTAFFGTNVGFSFDLHDPSGKALPDITPNVFMDLDPSKFPFHRFGVSGFGEDVGHTGVGGTLTSFVTEGVTNRPTAFPASSVPEPSSLTLLVVGIAALGIRSADRRKRFQATAA